MISTTTPLLAWTEPPKQTVRYEVLEPSTWAGEPLPITSVIDIGRHLAEGNWLVVFYRRDCPNCRKEIPRMEQMARDLGNRGEAAKIALVEVPPYGPALVKPKSPCALGRLASHKDWFVTTPSGVLLKEGRVIRGWEEDLPSTAQIERLIGGYMRSTAVTKESRLALDRTQKGGETVAGSDRR